ncbi:dual specificity protein phosphatase 19 [Pelomyxa schiedti]|nr:dual specificity protein phosphatase 19 [Pelomyxa schiedti]
MLVYCGTNVGATIRGAIGPVAASNDNSTLNSMLRDGSIFLDEAHRNTWKWRGIFHLILFDDDGADSSGLVAVRDFLTTEGKVRSISVLQGGFTHFATSFPFLCWPLCNRVPVDLWPSLVKKCLFLGTYDNARNIAQLKTLKITHILNCAKSCTNCFVDRGITYLHLPLEDDPEQKLFPIANEAFSFLCAALENPSHQVLVHCLQGQSRSPAIVIAFLMATQSISFSEAFAIVHNARPSININTGFLQQLQGRST